MATATASVRPVSTRFFGALAPGLAAPCSSQVSLARISGPQLLSSHAIRHGKVAGRGQHQGAKREFIVHAEYGERRSGGGAGDFVAGFLLGGALFGAIGYLIAPTVNKSIAAAEKKLEEGEVEVEGEGEGPPKKLPKFLEDDEGLENTRKSLSEKIAQLNAAIDDVSAQLRADEGAFGSVNEAKTRKSLTEKIAQLNAAIDDVSAQLRADKGGFGSVN